MWAPSRCTLWAFCSCLIVLLLVDGSFAMPSYGSVTRCTHDNIKIRREWSSLPPSTRKDFLDAVNCLRQKPSIIPAGLTGSQSRYDDFTATHLNQTMRVHANAIFLHWHRHLIYLFEQALIKECGYQHTLPYWDWPLYIDNLYTSTMFDGSEYSFGDHGTYVPGLPDINEGGGLFIPRGAGGGCVTTGPFANMVVPFKELNFFDFFVFNGVLPSTALDYNPHCLTRDTSIGALQWANQPNVTYQISLPDFPSFNYLINGALAAVGVHTAGHQGGGGVNGDGSSTFGANADPFFYPHHAMVDLTYTVWQALDPRHRQYNITGGNTTAYLTSTAFNIPPSPIVTLDFVLNWGYLDQPRKLRDLMSVTAGPYCYRYDYDSSQYPKPAGAY